MTDIPLKIDQLSYTQNLSSIVLKLKPKKKSDLNGIQGHDLCDKGTVHNCLSCAYNCDDQSKIHIFLWSSNI